MGKIDKVYQDFLSHYPAPMRKSFYAARRALSASRCGVMDYVLAGPASGGVLEVRTSNTKCEKPVKFSVTRKFYIGRSGGLYIERKGKRCYFKATEFGKGGL